MKHFATYIKVNAKRLSWSIVLFLFLLLPLFSSAQQLTLDRKIIPKEISKHATYTILEDSYGFIWLGGRGLYRYDGYELLEYPLTSNSARGLAIIHELTEDSSGNIWIGTHIGLFRYDRSSDQLQPFVHEKLTNQYGKTPNVKALFYDSKGRLWASGLDRLFVLSKPDGEAIDHPQQLQVASVNWKSDGSRVIMEDRNGQIWSTSNDGLLEVSPALTVIRHKPEEFTRSAAEFRLVRMIQGRGDTLWLTSSEGLWAFNTEQKKFIAMSIPGYSRKWTAGLLMDGQGQLWVATKDGIFQRQIDGHIQKKIAVEKNLLYDGIRTLHFDRQGNLWFGNVHGAGMLDFNSDQRLPFYQVGMGSPIHDNHFYRIHQDATGAFWFRMAHSGLGYCPELGGPFEIILQPSVNYFSEEVKSICSDADGNIWVTTLTNGLFFFEKGRKEYRRLLLTDSLQHTAILGAMLADKLDDRLLWIGSRAGLMRLDRFTLQQKWFYPKDDLPWLRGNAIGNIGQSDEGDIWCSLWLENQKIAGYFDKKTERFVADKHLPGRPEATNMYQLQQVAPAEMWVATNKGFIIVDTKKKTQRFWTTANGLPTTNPYGFMPDRQGNIWFVDRYKIYKYDGQQFEMFNPNAIIERFDNTTSAFINDRLIAFGGANGMHVFDPKRIAKDTITPIVHLTDFRVFNKKKDLGMALERVQHISLTHADKVFSFEFAGLHFTHASRMRYQHILEGFEVDWVETGSDERRATYTNLAPGKYTFRVRAANADGFWTPESEMLHIQLAISPPWYRTCWAYGLWAVLILGSIYWLYRFQLNRKLAEAEALRLKEIDLAKSRLYTNITHEFRTPLTIILGMADQMKADPKKWFSEGLRLIRRNGKQLLTLVNQLLDLSKLESGQMSLNLVHGDLVGFIHYLSESFHSYADSKDIRLHFSSDFKERYMDYDPEKMQQVMTNLLSNAIKFTPAGGDVYIQLLSGQSEWNIGPKKITVQRNTTTQSGEYLLLVVKDNGQGIPADHLPHIFDRFYQGDASTTRSGDGTGIGLALTKELVKRMGGEILVESETETQTKHPGTTFTIALPITHSATAVGKPFSEKYSFPTSAKLDFSKASIGQVPKNDLPLVLIIEDNPDVITYLSSFLSIDYQVETAINGQYGIEKALEQTPDLIVSDVMMPEKDGFEVCETLKKDERTSHIPIILLTAKSDPAARLEGLTHGADAYLAKPFNKEELLVRMEKLIELRRRLQTHYAKTSNLLKVAKKSKPTSEDLFLQKLMAIIEENLSDENFGLPELCRKAHLSRSQLFRKLKALTGKSTTRFIRSIRLAKGRELLETTDQTVSEVAYVVGFNSPSYFSTMFKEEYGFSPGELRK